MNEKPIYSVNQVHFNSGFIITVSSMRDNAFMWLGYPEDMLVDIFIKTRRVETVNRFLTDIKVPWRVSDINIVDGQPQWTVA